jgi:hypothetical protein
MIGRIDPGLLFKVFRGKVRTTEIEQQECTIITVVNCIGNICTYTFAFNYDHIFMGIL